MSALQRQGRVITRFGADLLVETEQDNTLVRCTAKRKFDHVACGDYVTIELAEHGNARLVDIAPRKNTLTRPDYRHQQKTIAANIDQLLVMMAWRPEPFWLLLDRYLVTATMMDASVVILMNKQDLADQYATRDGLGALQEYVKIGYPVVKLVADGCVDEQADALELQQLQQLMSGQSNILVGQSGVGKSSLAALLLPDKEILTGEISQSGEGRHTTTTTTLYHLPTGGHLIDSPGVRDFPLPQMSALQLRQGYREFSEYSRSACKFNNCTHAHEPGCQVRVAVEAGKLPPKRYQRYLKLLSDIQ